MSFVGEVLVDFFELNKHPQLGEVGSGKELRYHKELEDMKRRQRKKKKALEQKEEQRNAKEAAQIASLEEAASAASEG